MAVGVVVVMVLSGLGAMSVALPGSIAAESHAALSWAGKELSRAEASLAQGFGPAAGAHPLSCQAPSDLSARCAMLSAPAAGTPVPGTQLRYAFAMTWDAIDGYVLLFGGCSPTSGSICPAGDLQGDTWDFLGGTWTQLHPAASPTPRWGAAMAYDAHDSVVVLYGGCTATGALSCPAIAQDTWIFVGGSWTQFSASSPPGLLYWASMAYDSNDSYILMVGGCIQTGPICPAIAPAATNPTWSFTTALGWNVVARGNPPPRYDAGLANDPQGDDVILFGGCGAAGTICPNPLGDTWSYSAGVWTHKAPATNPPARFGHEMTYDSVDGYVLMMGGCPAASPPAACGAPPLPDIWYWNPIPRPGNWIAVATSFLPTAGYEGGLAPDPTDGYTVYLEGCTSSGNLCASASTAACTWETFGSSWYPLCGAAAPGGRFGSSMAFDPLIGSSGKVVLFGGCAATCPVTSDTWTYLTGTWAKMTLSTTVKPPARWDANLVWDAADGYLLLFGGCTTAPAAGGCPTTHLLSDYWILVWNPSTSKGAWTNLCPGGGCTAPGARYDASMAFDADSTANEVVLFGGYVAAGPACDVWTFTGGVWTSLGCPAGGPGSIYGAATTYYPGSGLLVTGGATTTGVTAQTYFYKPGTGWTHVLLTNPSARMDAMMAYDAVGLTVDLFGGCSTNYIPCPTTNLLGDTYSYGWTAVTPTTSPPPRASAGVAWDSADSYMLVYSGANNIGTFADTWSYYSGAGTWTYQ
jgi:hypothetical protein